MATNEKEFVWPVRVYYEDTDAGGVVFYANYLKFIERARTEWLRALGYEQDELLRLSVVFVVRKVDIDYLRPARFNDELEVVSCIKQLKHSSLRFEQKVLRKGELCVSAEVVVVCVETEKFKPRAFPEKMKEDFLRVS